MNTIHKIPRDEYPTSLMHIPQPPKQLYIRGNMPRVDNVCVCIVGSRKYTPYGSEVCQKLISGLRGYPITIISGLAMGIDGIAHQAALDTGLQTVAIVGSGLEDSVLYPQSNFNLAQRILASGGGIISEYDPDHRAAPYNFPERNRLMAAISKATIIVEAEEKSGSLITSFLATEYDREVGAVPGSIMSRNSGGPHKLIKIGAVPITSSADILNMLGFTLSVDGSIPVSRYTDCAPEELEIIELLEIPMNRENIFTLLSRHPPSHINTTISLLELKGFIKSVGDLLYLV